MVFAARPLHATWALMSVALDPTRLTPPDSELVTRVRAGDHDAVAMLYRRYGTPLLRLAARLTGSREDGEDVVQDVFVSLPLTVRKYEESGRFDAWLRRITARVAITRVERRTRRREVDLKGAADRAVGSGEDELAARVSLEAAIAELPDTLRVVFVLRMVEQYTHEQIADTVGIRRGTSEVRLYRAIRTLRARLGDAL